MRTFIFEKSYPKSSGDRREAFEEFYFGKVLSKWKRRKIWSPIHRKKFFVICEIVPGQ